MDTADVYSSWVPGLAGGESETVIGEWLAQRKRRDDIVLMTKVGMWENRKGLSPVNINAALEESLRRLAQRDALRYEAESLPSKSHRSTRNLG